MPLAEVPNMIPALPEIFIAVIAMALLVLGVFQKSDNASDCEKSFRLISLLSVVTLVLAILLVATVGPKRMTTFNSMFVSDTFSMFFKVLVLLASALAIVISKDYMKHQGLSRFEFPLLILFATIGMMMMISANDLLSLYLGIEIQSLSLYVLAAFQREDARSTEAGLKYFVLGALASGMLLYGASLVYGFTGATNFDVIAALIHGSSDKISYVGLVFDIVFMMAGLFFKVSAAPFHMWAPDVYEGAPTPVTAFFAVGPKLAAIALFIRLMVGPFAEMVDQWQQVVVLVSMASMIIGAFAAINQTNIKRMMAYSSIGHIGYALIGLAVGDELGIRGILIYMSIYLFMNIGAFSCILCMRRGDNMVEKISDLAGFSKSHPMAAFAMAIFMFSMAGIPPLAGFFGKLYIFLAAIRAEMYTLAIIGVLTSVVSAFYYLRIIKVMYFDDLSESVDKPIGREITFVITTTSIIILFFFVYPSPFLASAAAAATALF